MFSCFQLDRFLSFLCSLLSSFQFFLLVFSFFHVLKILLCLVIVIFMVYESVFCIYCLYSKKTFVSYFCLKTIILQLLLCIMALMFFFNFYVCGSFLRTLKFFVFLEGEKFHVWDNNLLPSLNRYGPTTAMILQF